MLSGSHQAYSLYFQATYLLTKTVHLTASKPLIHVWLKNITISSSTKSQLTTYSSVFDLFNHEQNKQAGSNPLKMNTTRSIQSNSTSDEKLKKKIRKLRTGGKPWSPTLQKQRDTIWAISLLIKKRYRRQVSNRLIRCTLKKTDLIGAYSKTVTELHEMLDEAFTAYKQSNAELLRDEFLPSLAQARATYFGTNTKQNYNNSFKPNNNAN